MKATVNKIIKNTFIDGPGSRMAIFLQGCNLSCLYCHNPETQRLCCNCRMCIDTCPSKALKLNNNEVAWNKDVCIGCDSCIAKCSNFSSPKITQMDAEQLYSEIISIESFIDGITFSGGECTLHYEFIYELFGRIKKDTGLTTFIDTNGYAEHVVMDMLAKVTDGFMIDLKCFNTTKHIELTSKPNDLIMKNIEFISSMGLLYEIRTVIVPGFTDTREEVQSIASYIKKLNDYTKFKIIPFRPNGVRTYMKNLQAVNVSQYDEFVSIARDILGGERVVKVRTF